MSPSRVITLDAVHNFRDLGGYVTADGRVTRWRRLFRADGLQRLAADDLETVRALGLRTVIDLRSDAEVAERGRFPHEQHPVRLHHLPIFDSTAGVLDGRRFDDGADFLHWAYHNMLAVGSPRFAAAIAFLAEAEALPAVFHSAAGKDRTGLLAALVLGALGVSNEQIVDDYVLTMEGMARLRNWAQREYPQLVERMDTSPPGLMSALPEAMHRVLDDLVAAHGSVRGYVTGIGVSAGALDLLADELLSAVTAAAPRPRTLGPVQGTLALQGGGPFVANDELDGRLLKAAGARKVVVLPTADAYEHPERLVAAALSWSERLDVEVEALMVMRRGEALEPGVATIVRDSRAVYLVGDQPLHLRSVLKDTPLWDAVGDVLAAGGLVAACAGSAAALCDPLVDPRGGAFTLGLGLVDGLALVTESERWSAERLHRTRELANTALATLPTGAALVRTAAGWERVGELEVIGDLP